MLATFDETNRQQFLQAGRMMSEYVAELVWNLGQAELSPGKYSTNHKMSFGGGLAATMTSAPDYGGDPRYVNPEEAMAAALSSCHMMTFLALSAKAKWKVKRYTDRAIATLGKTPDGRVKVGGITLNPVVTFEDGQEISNADLETMHERAHRYCFVANALDCDMSVKV